MCSNLTMILTHKILLQPRTRQADWLTEQCGYERWCYNQMLSQFKQGLDNGIWWDKYTLAYDLRRNKPDWTAGRWAKASEQARDRLDAAIRNWLNPDMPNAFPRFRRKAIHMTCSFFADFVRLGRRRIRIPKLGWVRMRESLRFDGKLVGNAAVTYDGRRWWVSLTVDTGVEPGLSEGEAVVGVDVGIRTMAVTSDGVEYSNPKPLASALSELRSINKAIARSVSTHGRNRTSNRRNRLYALRRRMYERIANIRRNAHRQAASAIVKTADVVCVETLNVRGMVKNKRLALALSDVGLGDFLREIAWQCSKRGVRLIEADQWYPSSKTCSGCGAMKRRLMLSEREYVCGGCGLVIDRDRNAATNLETAAFRLMRGEAVRPAVAGAPL